MSLNYILLINLKLLNLVWIYQWATRTQSIAAASIMRRSGAANIINMEGNRCRLLQASLNNTLNIRRNDIFRGTMKIPILITISLCHQPVHQVRVSEILPTPLRKALGQVTGRWRTSFQWWKAKSWAARTSESGGTLRQPWRQTIRLRNQTWRHFKMSIGRHHWLLFLICRLFSKFHTTIK